MVLALGLSYPERERVVGMEAEAVMGSLSHSSILGSGFGGIPTHDDLHVQVPQRRKPTSTSTTTTPTRRRAMLPTAA